MTTDSPVQPVQPDDLVLRAVQEWERLLPQTTEGVWKTWGQTVLADQDGSGDVTTALPVAYSVQAVMGEDGQPHPRVFDAEWICRAQPVVGRALVELLLAVNASEMAMANHGIRTALQGVAREILRESP